MIGVLVRPDEKAVALEFFELFKTAWSFADEGRSYEVVISTGSLPAPGMACLVLLFDADAATPARVPAGRAVASHGPSTLTWAGRQLPMYGGIVTFPGSRTLFLRDKKSGAALVSVDAAGAQTIVRVGYNLFGEVRHLLTAGQPLDQAHVPTLELHIAILRQLLVGAGVPVVEIPPVPDGHAFTACLTHDIDHPVLGNHRFDRTMFGFLQRSTIGSLRDALSGRISPWRLGRKWAAAARLPFVHLGVAEDPWRQFDRYLELEAGMRSTYFALTVANDAGLTEHGRAPAERACRYQITEIVPQLQRVMSAGCEVCLHGLNAWRDSAAARKEQEIFQDAIRSTRRGIRMHWLYFGPQTIRALEEAGFTYDSSIGYNEVVGYRTGTTQVYRPLGARTLLELPLHIMDTALFSAACMHLREDEALDRLSPLIDDATTLGGAVTINWHDRSIAAERLWDEFYAQLLQRLQRRGAWFPTTGEAVDWFALRRSATIAATPVPNGRIAVRAQAPGRGDLPALRLRVHQPPADSRLAPYANAQPAHAYDVRLDISAELLIQP